MTNLFNNLFIIQWRDGKQVFAKVLVSCPLSTKHGLVFCFDEIQRSDNVLHNCKSLKLGQMFYKTVYSRILHLLFQDLHNKELLHINGQWKTFDGWKSEINKALISLEICFILNCSFDERAQKLEPLKYLRGSSVFAGFCNQKKKGWATWKRKLKLFQSMLHQLFTYFQTRKDNF